MADETELRRSMTALYLATESDIAKHHNELTEKVISELKEELKTAETFVCKQDADHEMVGLVREITDKHGAAAVPFLDDAVHFLVDELEWLRFFKKEVYPCLGPASGEILDSLRAGYLKTGKALPASETD